MNDLARSILTFLQQVQAERDRRDRDLELASRVAEVKRYQQDRFAKTYTDLLAAPRTGPAARFFLDDLYGPQDFSARDGQFARVVPSLVRLFPDHITRTVLALAELHALSEGLDTAMACAMSGQTLDAATYRDAWRTVGRPSERELQVVLMLRIGFELDRHTRSRLIQASLHLMRGPAVAAGLGALQAFLERGFDAFKMLPDAAAFLNHIARTERSLSTRLFGEVAGD